MIFGAHSAHCKVSLGQARPSVGEEKIFFFSILHSSQLGQTPVKKKKRQIDK